MRIQRQEVLDDIAFQIAEVRREHPLRVAIDGVDAAGKTPLADALVQPLQRLGRSVIPVSIDRFHHPAELRRRHELRYIPGKKLYFSEVQPEVHASVVIDNNYMEMPK